MGGSQVPGSGLFQSTLPAGEATCRRPFDVCGQPISIHASRGGSDDSVAISVEKTPDFNPRFPRGKRPRSSGYDRPAPHFNPRFPRGKRRQSSPPLFLLSVFQSTLPAGEATYGLYEMHFGKKISIHASRGGSDIKAVDTNGNESFQSTLPAGEAT